MSFHLLARGLGECRYRGRMLLCIQQCASSTTTGRTEHIIKLSDQSKTDERQKHSNLTLGSLLLLIGPATALGLGVWQIYRLQWKQKLIANIKKQLSAEAVNFPVDDLSAVLDMEYRRVKLRGRYLYENEFIIQPRGRFDEAHSDRDGGGSLIGNPASSSHGGHVVTPFQIEGTNLVIMVNRGWLPQFALKTPPRLSDVGECVSIEAIVRKTEKKPSFVSSNVPEKDHWFYKNFIEMSERCGALPIYVEAVFSGDATSWPIGGQTNVNIRNQHLSYIVTWLALFAVTTAMWMSKYMRRS